MIAFLNSIIDKVWNRIEVGYTRLTIVANGEMVPKSKAQWTKEEKQALNYNKSRLMTVLMVSLRRVL